MVVARTIASLHSLALSGTDRSDERFGEGNAAESSAADRCDRVGRRSSEEGHQAGQLRIRGGLTDQAAESRTACPDHFAFSCPDIVPARPCLAGRRDAQQRPPSLLRCITDDSVWVVAGAGCWIHPARDTLQVPDFIVRRGSQAVDGTGLENRQGESPRGFESHPLRHIILIAAGAHGHRRPR